METRRGVWLAWVVGGAGVFLAVASLQAGPLKNPRRGVQGHTVDLTPLFHWWTNQSGLRPLRSWVQVTGPIVATNALGWVVAAHPEHPSAEARGGAAENSFAGQSRIILRHPPLAEAAVFASLQDQLKQLNAQHQRLAASINNLSHPHVRGRGAGIVNARIKASAQEPKMELEAVDAQIKSCKAKLAAFPDPDTFKVDCLALDLGENHGTLPIYDYGFVQPGN